ncbi:MAG: VOC family protein [Candidatus Solibacter sp.]
MAQLEEFANNTSTLETMDMKLEVVVIPVSDIDRAKRFYAGLGWRLDADFGFENGFRVVQFTPPGSAASVQFGTEMTPAAPGSAQNLYLVVTDIVAARGQVASVGADVSEVFHPSEPGAAYRSDGNPSFHLRGVSPEHASYGSFATFRDPDGNGWLLQEVTRRLPGRIDREGARFASVSELAAALRRASHLHGEREKSAHKQDVNWPEWYAEYMVAEQTGRELPQ